LPLRKAFFSILVERNVKMGKVHEIKFTLFNSYLLLYNKIFKINRFLV